VQVLLIVTLIGLASAAFHPEGSRVAHMAAGSRKGLGQSIFQVGGNAGQSMGPLMIPLLFTPFGLHGAYWLLFPVGLVGLTLFVVSRWYQQNAAAHSKRAGSDMLVNRYGALVLLVVVVSLRSWIQSGISSFLQLYYINVFGFSLDVASMYLFAFLMAGAIGTFVGGPLADRYGKKNLLMFSMLGSIPFILLVPHLTGVLALVNIFLFGLISLCSFAVTVVYAQEFVPGKVGMVSGLMIGFAIGAGGIGASIMGKLADVIGIANLIQLLVVLPVVGWVLGMWLPKDQVRAAAAKSVAVEK
jgi:FSR family fosmidomycin resistance protein-like MFS transporter